MKLRVLTSRENSLQIVTDVTKTICYSDAVLLTTNKSLIDRIFKVINKEFANFKPLYDDIPIKFQQDLQNNKFNIEGSSINGPNRVFIF